MKETYNSIDPLLSAVNYQNHNWLIYGGLLVAGLVFGLPDRYKKYPCFLCLWDSRLYDQHYIRQKWLLREGLRPSSQNVQSHPLVEPNKIVFPILHIKFGVMNDFVK